MKVVASALRAIAKTATLEFGSDEPARLTVQAAGIRASSRLAPRIENE